jgi:hypothetical protein
MATVEVFGPYIWDVTIPVGQPHNFLIGPDDRLAGPRVIHATASPGTHLRRTPFALYLHDMSVAKMDVGHGDISNILTTVYATFVNSGTETINSYAAYFSVVTQ